MHLLLVAFVVALVSAHESRIVADGNLKLTVGFLVEPAITLNMNGVDLTVRGGAPNFTTPVTGMEAEVIVTVTHVGSGVSRLFVISGVFGTPGKYKTQFFPTQNGTYSFHFVGSGSVTGFPFDETFVCGVPGVNATGSFGCMLHINDYYFPTPLPDITVVAAQATNALSVANNALAQANYALANATYALQVAQEALAAANAQSNPGSGNGLFSLEVLFLALTAYLYMRFF